MNDVSIVTLCKNGIINQIFAFKYVGDAEEFFKLEISERGVEPTDEAFENGYFEFEDGEAICINSSVQIR